MGLFRSLTGLLTVQLTSADLSAALTQISEMNVQLLGVEWLDELTCRATVQQRDYIRLRECVQHRGDQLKIIKKSGIYFSTRSLMRRPVLLTGVVIFLLFRPLFLFCYFSSAGEGVLNAMRQSARLM